MTSIYFFRNNLDDHADDFYGGTENSLVKSTENDAFSKDINIFA